MKPQSYLIQTVPSKEITLNELIEYTKDENIEVEFDNELTHIMNKYVKRTTSHLNIPVMVRSGYITSILTL